MCVCVRRETVEQENAGVHDRCAAVKASSPVTLPALPKVTHACTQANMRTPTHSARDRVAASLNKGQRDLFICLLFLRGTDKLWPQVEGDELYLLQLFDVEDVLITQRV